ncbi:MAG: SHOCT domain-containing protein [Bacteroidetes bacterium]|nr:MAG: SHOCT domain-containing protein [Bacteroidota bacterium]MBL1145160.1 SHOCT domain-containing protein [Bacteroidota bacterium]NOG57956.1 SHOCT domain-containing protein [Bacteroidota bacterium]
MKLIQTILFAITISLLFSSCALIVGGSKYNAIVEVVGAPDASIYYKGKNIGIGNASIRIPRNQADKLIFAVRKDGCDEKQYVFTTRKYRGWAFAGSLITYTIILPGGVPIPLGVIFDFAFSANWKPNKYETGIQKMDYKNYKYTLEYSDCNSKPAEDINFSIKEQLKGLEELFNNGDITEEEYKASRKKVLGL